jgi:hypothetical protein
LRLSSSCSVGGWKAHYATAVVAMHNFTGKAGFASKKAVRFRKIPFRNGITDNRTADYLSVNMTG